MKLVVESYSKASGVLLAIRIIAARKLVRGREIKFSIRKKYFGFQYINFSVR